MRACKRIYTIDFIARKTQPGYVFFRLPSYAGHTV